MDDTKQAFWSMADLAAAAGITRPYMGKLAKHCGDYVLAIGILEQCIGSSNAREFLGAMIRNMQTGEPKIAGLARMNGVQVQRTMLADGTTGWKIGDAIYNRDGVDVGG